MLQVGVVTNMFSSSFEQSGNEDGFIIAFAMRKIPLTKNNHKDTLLNWLLNKREVIRIPARHCIFASGPNF